MGRYLVIDREERSIELINESLKIIDIQPHLENFSDLKAFESHIQLLKPEESSAFWNFDLIILDYGLCLHTQWPDQLAFIKKNNVKECAVLLTGYENNFTAPKFIRPLDIYNFIFKPFDPLILKESLNISLKIKKKAQPLELKSQSATAFIAILKEVELQTISELGFVTLSDSQIETGSVAKFFSPIFLHGRKQSAWAQCIVSVPHPQKKGSFINKFQFYAADQTFLNNLRRYIIAHKHDNTSSALWNFNPPKTVEKIKMALIGIENDENKSMAQDIERRYGNLSVEIIKLDPTKKTADTTYDHHLVLNNSDIKFENLNNYFKKEAIFLWLTPPFQKEDDIKASGKSYQDIFIKPLDRSYFYKKLKIHCNLLKELEQSHLTNITSREKMKAANKVKISEISELYVNLVYSRELPFKELREFVFLSDDESQAVELPAFCNYTEKNQSADPKEGPSFMHQFVFFGMTDQLSRQIRLWLLRNYIDQNQKND